MPELDRLLTIQSATEAQDASGEPIETWADLEADVPCEYIPVSGAEQFQAFQHLATATARFRVRYRDDLTRKMRIVFGGENWNLRHWEEDRRYDRRQYMILTAEVIAAT